MLSNALLCLQETAAKLSSALTGKPKTQEHRDAIAAAARRRSAAASILRAVEDVHSQQQASSPVSSTGYAFSSHCLCTSTCCYYGNLLLCMAAIAAGTLMPLATCGLWWMRTAGSKIVAPVSSTACRHISQPCHSCMLHQSCRISCVSMLIFHTHLDLLKWLLLSLSQLQEALQLRLMCLQALCRQLALSIRLL